VESLGESFTRGQWEVLETLHAQGECRTGTMTHETLGFDIREQVWEVDGRSASALERRGLVEIVWNSKLFCTVARLTAAGRRHFEPKG
jgi:hypothetical protein